MKNTALLEKYQRSGRYEKYRTVRKIETEIYIDCGLTFVFFLKLRNKIQNLRFYKIKRWERYKIT